MTKRTLKQPKWFDKVEEDDFEAAESYLGLIYSSKRGRSFITALRAAKPARFKAKDIFRAAQLSNLGVSNARVAKDRKKIKAGDRLSPLLLIRDEGNGKVVVADGYHRLCAVYEVNEETWIPCRIV